MANTDTREKPADQENGQMSQKHQPPHLDGEYVDLSLSSSSIEEFSDLGGEFPHSSIFFCSHPSSVFTHSSPGERQSRDKKGMTTYSRCPRAATDPSSLCCGSWRLTGHGAWAATQLARSAARAHVHLFVASGISQEMYSLEDTFCCFFSITSM